MKAVLNTTSLDKAARSAKAGGERIVLTDITAKGLQLHASPSGRRAWYLSCRDAFNKPRQFFLGAYPGLGVSEARDEARGLRERVRQGYDPTKDKRRLKGLGDAARVHTLGDLITAYEKNPDVPESWAGLKACVLRVFKPLLNEPLAGMKAADFNLAMLAFPKYETAKKAGRSIHAVLGWGATIGTPRHLTDFKTKGAAERERFLSRDELKKIIPLLLSSKKQYDKCMMFILWTAARRGEAEMTKWRDIDFEQETWSPDKFTTKNDKPHILKLPRQAIEFLRQHKPESAKPSDFVFPNAHGTNKPISNWDRPTKSLQKKSKVFGWHRHDLRRTASTSMGNLQVDPYLVEAALNHEIVKSPIARIYNKSNYSEPVGEALQVLANYYEGIFYEVKTEQQKLFDIALSNSSQPMSKSF
jgi:integrase